MSFKCNCVSLFFDSFPVEPNIPGKKTFIFDFVLFCFLYENYRLLRGTSGQKTGLHFSSMTAVIHCQHLLTIQDWQSQSRIHSSWVPYSSPVSWNTTVIQQTFHVAFPKPENVCNGFEMKHSTSNCLQFLEHKRRSRCGCSGGSCHE